jgi:hypothetical protein
MTMGSRNNPAKIRFSAIPAWVKRGAAGLVALGLARWAPAGIDVVLIIGGSIMVLAATIGLRMWVSELVPRATLLSAREGFNRPMQHGLPPRVPTARRAKARP